MSADTVARQRAREQAREQVQKMEAIARLTSGIARDFNQLLTAILAHAEAMAPALPLERDDLRRELDGLTAAARRGTDLVHRLLGFSRGERLRPQPVSVAEHVAGVLEALRRRLPAGIELQFEADGEGGVAEVDATAVEQIVIHLATNARDAMPHGGALHVEVRHARLNVEDRPLYAWIEPGPYVSIAVSDTGAGMDAATQARLFEPFFTTKPAGVGTGLGMAMVYGLVKQHRGFVHVYSEVGQGTTVKVYLPAVHARPAEPPEAAAEALPGGTETILLVEDNAALRQAARRLLEKVGYRVLTAADGEEGLRAYQAHRAGVDLVITDMIMPKLSGFELYEAVRRDSRAMKVLFTSGFPAPNFRKSVGRDPAAGFVTKPWEVTELLARIRQLLGPPQGERS